MTAESWLCRQVSPSPISAKSQVASQQIKVNFNQQQFKWVNWVMNCNSWGRVNAAVSPLLRYPPGGERGRGPGSNLLPHPNLIHQGLWVTATRHQGNIFCEEILFNVSEGCKIRFYCGKTFELYLPMSVRHLWKISFSFKKILFDLFFYKYTENLKHLDFIAVLWTHHF